MSILWGSKWGFYFHFFLLGPAHDPPIDGQEDDHEEGSSVQEHRDRQGWVCTGEQPMQGSTKVSGDAQHVDGAERLNTDVTAQVKRDSNHQEDIETENAKPHPERAIAICKRHQKLQNGERQELVEQ